MMHSFADMDSQDRNHMADIGRVNGYTMPELNNRASDISKAILSLDAIKPVLSRRYLVKGWLDRGAASVVYGESNVGKTFFALDLALHVAAKQAWHGHKVPADTNAPVIYVAGEGGTGINNRIEAIRHDNPGLLVNSSFNLLPTSLDLCGATDGAALADAIGDTKASLIVIDTLARTMGDGDENSAKDMGAFIRNVDLLRDRTGAHVMVIHHSGKDSSRGARGSGSLRAAVDTEIELTRSEGVVMADMRKQRDMACDPSFAYRLESVVIGIDEDGDQVTSAVVREAEPVKKVPKLSGQQKIAMQALDDALAHHGERKNSDMFPANRCLVHLDRWAEYCSRHSLSNGNGDSSARAAFHKVKNALQDKELVRVIDGYVWRCFE